MHIDWEQTRVRLGRVTRVRCEPGWSLDETWARRLADFDLFLIWAGRGRMRLHRSVIELRPGVCLWMRPGGTYVATQELTDRLGVNAIHFELVGPPPAALPPEVNDVANLAFFEAVTSRVVALQRGDATGQAVAERLFTGLLMELDRQAVLSEPMSPTEQRHQAVIGGLAAWLRESPHESPPVGVLARQAGYSPDHFARVFKRVMGVGPELFVVQCKIDRAKQLLLETGMSIQQVAEALGYCDVYFFSRQFKQRTGRSPVAYRRAAAGAV